MNIHKRNNKYDFHNKNDIMNIFRFSAFEFLSVGVWIDISLVEVNSTTTSITIEIIRKVGSFDQPHEVSNAMRHLSTIINIISSELPKVVSEDALSETIELTKKVESDYIVNLIKDGIGDMLKKYDNTYLVLSSDEKGYVIKRLPKTNDSYVSSIETIIKINILSENKKTILDFFVSNPTNSLQKVGEKNRNNLVLEITEKLINEAISNLSIIKKLNSEVSALNRAETFKLFRSKAKKELEINVIQKKIDSLKKEIYY